MSLPRVGYWTANYMPEYEAISKEIAALMEGLAGSIDASLVSLDTRDRRLALRGRVKRLPIPFGLPLFPLLAPQVAGADVNHVFASAADRRLTPFMARYNGVLSLARGTGDGARMERNRSVLRRLRAVVAQCEPDRDLMLRLGVAERSLHLIRPGIPMAVYREPRGPFTVLFASSPFSEREFVSRGVHLMIQAASRLPDVRFLLIWRRHHVGTLRRLLREAGATNIEVRDGVVADMGAVYDSVHATVLPALEHGSFIPAPRSGLESLAHGKPLLASHYVSIAGSLAETGAGVVFEPTPEELVSAVQRLRQQYTAVQSRAQVYIRERYSPERHLDLYRRLYRAICS